ncbi:MAG: hypothetical protein LUF30_10685, partial [Lachnospiraceae bacterium]|nr:hypothetical protein [Lachnospiraceae bacterium]
LVLQVFFSAKVGYSLARVNFWGRGLVYALVILVFLTPRQSLLLAQYLNFVHFDVLGIMNLFTKAGEVNLINNPIVLPMLAGFCSGVGQSVIIYLFSQRGKREPRVS